MEPFDHQFEGWTVVEKLGQGGMCVVYRAHRDGQPTDEHAIKVLVDPDKNARVRFLDEGAMLLALDHPNLLTVEQVVDAHPPWLVMELLAGKDLEAHRDSADAFAPEVVASWIADVANGLQRCHDTGIVHRDLKPSNLMLGEDGTPRLIDFGVARDTAQAHKTRAGVVMGTASYLPPEVFLESSANRLQDNPAADVYALGQTLAELLIGRPIHRREAFDGPHMLVQIMRDKVSRPHLDPREWNPSVPDGLAEIVVAATHQEPEERIETARELERQLRTWAVQRSERLRAPVSLAPTEMPRPPSPTSRPPTLPPAVTPTHDPLVPTVAVGAGAVGLLGLLLVVVLGILLVGLGILWVARPDPSTRQTTTAVQRLLVADARALRPCVDRRVALALQVEVRGGRVQSVDATPAESVDLACVRGVTDGWKVRGPDGTVQLSVELAP